MRRLRYTGPGAVLVGVQHERAEGAGGRWLQNLSPGHRSALTMWEPSSGPAHESGQVIALASGARLWVRSAARPGVTRR
jgi:hypothetical protein